MYRLTFPHYNYMRDEMVTAISQVTHLSITTEVLLFGTDEVSNGINTSIFKALQKLYKDFKAICILIFQNGTNVSWTLGP